MECIEIRRRRLQVLFVGVFEVEYPLHALHLLPGSSACGTLAFTHILPPFPGKRMEMGPSARTLKARGMLTAAFWDRSSDSSRHRHTRLCNFENFRSRFSVGCICALDCVDAACVVHIIQIRGWETGKTRVDCKGNFTLLFFICSDDCSHRGSLRL